MSEKITLTIIKTTVDGLAITMETLATSIDDLARMVADGFAHQREEMRNDLRTEVSRLDFRIDKLDAKIDYRFDTLSNRMDDLALNKVSRQEHVALAQRVSDIESAL